MALNSSYELYVSHITGRHHRRNRWFGAAGTLALECSLEVAHNEHGKQLRRDLRESYLDGREFWLHRTVGPARVTHYRATFFRTSFRLEVDVEDARVRNGPFGLGRTRTVEELSVMPEKIVKGLCGLFESAWVMRHRDVQYPDPKYILRVC